MSKKLPVLKPKQVLRVFLKVGFFVYTQRGSHIHLRHCVKRHLRVTIPYHTNFDLPPSIIQSILKQAEISKKEFLELL